MSINQNDDDYNDNDDYPTQIDDGPHWDGDMYVDDYGNNHDTTDGDFEWSTGHTPCGDDDN